MPTIYFAKALSPVKVESGSNLMKSLTEAGIPVGSSCGGEGICTKCLIQVKKGHDNLSERNKREQDLNEKYSFPEDRRVSCQTSIIGDIEIDTDYW